MTSDLVAVFPQMATEPYLPTSSATFAYNCVAHAFKDDARWWEPDPLGMYYWPIGRREKTIKAWVLLAESFGYVSCDNGNLESGFEKIAIYILNQRPSHITRQLDDGTWTSKLGSCVDISHTLAGLEGTEYGRLARYLKKPKPSTGTIDNAKT